MKSLDFQVGLSNTTILKINFFCLLNINPIFFASIIYEFGIWSPKPGIAKIGFKFNMHSVTAPQPQWLITTFT